MTANPRTAQREITLPVGRERAWTMLRDAEGLSGWLADEVTLEVREGAEGALRWRDGTERAVAVEEVREHRRLSFVWREPEGDPTLVEISLDDVPQGTRIAVIEMPVLALEAECRSLDSPSRAASEGPSMLAPLA